jgi:uncharacterized repeat protein (TIGR01451 family)
MARRILATIIFIIIIQLFSSSALSPSGAKPAAARLTGEKLYAQDITAVTNPDISISVDPDNQIIAQGGTAEFSIKVENTGDVTLSNIVVTDTLTPPGCSENIDSLDPGKDKTISCQRTNVTDGFQYDATVEAEDGEGETVTDSVSAIVEIAEPSISISKTPESQTVLIGDTAEFQIIIENTGNVPLKKIEVTDEETGDCTQDIKSLDPDDPPVTYSCYENDVTNAFINVAQVTAEDDFNNDVSAYSNDAVVQVINPSISISKSPDNQKIPRDGSAQFTITVKNTGNVTLKNVTVSDSHTPECGGFFAMLQNGSTSEINCTETNVYESFGSKATVVAIDDLGHEVEAEDYASVQVADISISKEAEQTSIFKGDDAEFTITVQNTGDVKLTDVIVTDPKASDCDKDLGSLDSGAKKSYTCVKENVTSFFLNEASVSAIYDTSGNKKLSAADSASVQVIEPKVAINKLPKTQTIALGGTAEFTIVVQNTGYVRLVNVIVQDTGAPGCYRNYSYIDPGETKTIYCGVSGVENEFTSLAKVSATDIFSNSVYAEASSRVDVENPNIQIIKTLDNPIILRGGRAEFRIFVINTSDVVDLAAVTVEDPAVGNCNNFFPFLDQNQSKEYVCYQDGVTKAFTNEIKVTAFNSFTNDEVTDTSTVNVDILDLQAAMQINPPVQTSPGDAIDFSVTINNGGSVPFKLQSLIIDTLGSLTNPNNSNLENNTCESAYQNELEPGETYICTFSAESAEAPGIYPYKLTVEARNKDGIPVSDSVTSNLIIADSTLLSVSLEANPNSFPGPNASITVEEEIVITNLSQTSTLTLNSLIHSVEGNLNNVGTCTLPIEIEPGKDYSCVFDLEVTGESAGNIYHEVYAAGVTEDGMTHGGIAQTTIFLFDKISWLPLIATPVKQLETIVGDNNDPCSAYLLIPNLKYHFKLEDAKDWYQFNVLRSGKVSIQIENLVSNDIQVLIYKNDFCERVGDPDYVTHDGTSNTNKTLIFPAQPGHYFILVWAVDYSSSSLYTLKVLEP